MSGLIRYVLRYDGPSRSLGLHAWTHVGPGPHRRASFVTHTLARREVERAADACARRFAEPAAAAEPEREEETRCG